MIAAHKRDDAVLEFTMETGESFKARQFKTGSEFLSIERKMVVMREVIAKTPAPAWIPYLKEPIDEAALRMMLYIETLMIEPEISFFDCLRMHTECVPGYILAIGETLKQCAEKDFFGRVKQELDAEKNA